MIVDNRAFWSFLKTKGVTVRVQPVHEEPYAVMRVRSVVDLGPGRQTAVVEGYIPQETHRKSNVKKQLAMPNKIGNLNIVYRTKKINPVSNVYKVIAHILNHANTDKITPEVLAPGDFLVFTKKPNSKQKISIDALRFMSQSALGFKESYAL